nr:uncharacterized protein LOC113740823 [Coffea arabica]
MNKDDIWQNVPLKYYSLSLKYAIAYVQGDKYHGAKATINVWQPYVQNRIEFSLSQIWVVGGGGSSTNTIEAGWTVDADIFVDNKPRLFTYWTRHHYGSTGCYNVGCPGFVQTSKKMALGANISPVSTYPGPQFDISLYIVKRSHPGPRHVAAQEGQSWAWTPGPLTTVLGHTVTRVSKGSGKQSRRGLGTRSSHQHAELVRSARWSGKLSASSVGAVWEPKGKV